jgi:hypothetical protein
MSTMATPVYRASQSDASVRQILHRVDRAVKVGEGELRYQLDRKDDHPLAQADELLDVLVDLEDLGLVEIELCFRLTPQGRARLAELDTAGVR